MKKTFLSLLMSFALAFCLTPAVALADDGAAQDGGKTAYSITVKGAEGSKVVASKASAAAGETITLTATPSNGFSIGSVTANSDAGKVSLKSAGNGKFTFAMPAGNVTVTASFAQAPAPAPEPVQEAAPPADPVEPEPMVIEEEQVVDPAAPAEENAVQQPAVEDAEQLEPAVENADDPDAIAEGDVDDPDAMAQGEGDEANPMAGEDEDDAESAGGNDADTQDGAENTQSGDQEGTDPEEDETVNPASDETYTITIGEVQNGTVEADVETAAEGDTVTLTATPAEGYEFKEWSVKDADGNAVTVADGKFTMPASDVTVTATFSEVAPTTYAITLDKTKNGTISADKKTAAEGDTVKLTATADKCYAFSAWKVTDADGKEVTVSKDNSFTMPASDVTVDATFSGPDHEWGDWKVTKQATTSATGTETRTCKRCGATESKDIPKVVPVTYQIVSGANSTWTKGTNTTVTITVKRSVADETCFNHFTSVQIDGTQLAAGDYDAASGSTVVTFKAATLQRLNAGNHAVTINFDDGKAQTTMNIRAAAGGAGKGSTAKTGDMVPMGAVAALAALGVVGIGTIYVARKRMQGADKRTE